MPQTKSIRGIEAAPPRPTFGAALWLATILSVPVGALGIALEMLLS